jgi:copper resistance protein D
VGGLSTCYVLSRFIHFTSLMLVFGGSFFLTFLARGELRKKLATQMQRVLVCSILISFISAVMLFGFEAGLMGNGWSDVADVSTWTLVFNTHFGAVWRWELALAFLSCLALCLDSSRNAVLLLITAAQLIGLGFIGHAAIHHGWAAAIQHANAAVHLLSGAYWFGCLMPLFFCSHFLYEAEQFNDARFAMKQFSRYGHVAVCLVIVTGIMNGLFIIPAPYHWGALYLKLLLIKILFVFAMVLIALYNRYCLVPKIARDSETSVKKLFCLIWIEWSLALVVLLLVSLFATLAP